MDARRCNKRLEAVAGEVIALETLRALGVGRRASNATLERPCDNAVPRCMVSTAFPYLDRAAAEVQDGISCKGCQVAVETAGGKSGGLRPPPSGVLEEGLFESLSVVHRRTEPLECQMRGTV